MWAIINRVFNSEEYIKKLGVNINTDGTTNNLCEYTEHIRENIAGKTERYFYFYFVWATICGAFIYFVS